MFVVILSYPLTLTYYGVLFNQSLTLFNQRFKIFLEFLKEDCQTFEINLRFLIFFNLFKNIIAPIFRNLGFTTTSDKKKYDLEITLDTKR